MQLPRSTCLPCKLSVAGFNTAVIDSSIKSPTMNLTFLTRHSMLRASFFVSSDCHVIICSTARTTNGNSSLWTLTDKCLSVNRVTHKVISLALFCLSFGPDLIWIILFKGGGGGGSPWLFCETWFRDSSLPGLPRLPPTSPLRYHLQQKPLPDTESLMKLPPSFSRRTTRIGTSKTSSPGRRYDAKGKVGALITWRSFLGPLLVGSTLMEETITLSRRQPWDQLRSLRRATTRSEPTLEMYSVYLSYVDTPFSSDYPSHTQRVETSVKLTTAGAARVVGQNRQVGECLMVEASRKKSPGRVTESGLIFNFSYSADIL